MANSHVASTCARQIYLLLMHCKSTGCMAVHFTDAQKIYWMHGCPSSRIIHVQLVSKTISMLFSQSDCRDFWTHFIIFYDMDFPATNEDCLVLLRELTIPVSSESDSQNHWREGEFQDELFLDVVPYQDCIFCKLWGHTSSWWTENEK